ncbi:1,2-phenylacetyl-CoA epoxidase subunit PaaD [Planotetraspora sp. GP83]|uniref:1,2-phenylacetyl-CoA epoxidase subunit PaaD n=1 Tax=Planotetraspora sp. GP83 TaxID=3156264 RepID=UPI003519CEFA
MSESVRAAVAAVRDPELRVLSIEELGILRDVRLGPGGRVVVTITPTYLGCPALDVIRADIAAAAREAGVADVEIVTSLSPPWTTDWLTDTARAKLWAAGIAPPGSSPGSPPGARVLPLLGVPVLGVPVRCPRCGSRDTAEISRAGSTACKALRACHACREPFEHLKDH